MILDADTLQPAAAVDVLLRGASDLELPGTLKTEMHASVVELTTGICAGADEAVAALRELRRAAARIAADNGLALAAAGAHPTAPLESLPVVQEDRYLAMIRSIGRAARIQGVNGLHVHVGVDSGERCYERLEAVLPWLPVVLALSANSPFADGVDTGMQSTRAEILAALPRGAARRRSAPTRRGRRGSSGWWRSACCRTTRGSGGTSVRTRASGRWRSASPTSRRRSSGRRCWCG